MGHEHVSVLKEFTSAPSQERVGGNVFEGEKIGSEQM
jgi:hypothetical protein